MRGVAVIPARGGSKRIPRKNLLEIGGRPILERPISRALERAEISEVIVSTDDQEIAEVARSLGALVPKLRPARLSLDDTPTAPVVTYEIEQLAQNNNFPDFVLVLYPTSLFVTGEDLGAMTERLSSTDAPVEMVMTVSKFPAPIERSWRLVPPDVGASLNPDTRNKPSQYFEDHFYDAGQAYISTVDAWKKIDAELEVVTALHTLPAWKSWDINTPDDLVMAEMIIAFSETL